MAGKYLPRIERWPLFVSPFLIGLLLISGCEADPYPSDLIYPLRTDPLVRDTPSDDVLQPNPRGQLDEWIANLKNVSGAITADPMEIPTDQRAELERELRAVFGRPVRPIVRVNPDKDRAVERLQLSDAVLAHGSKLYRQHCLHCHGVSGNGRGPTAGWVNPHPRDYRRGYFKFTSVIEGGKTNRARREDLYRTVHEGVEGTTMPNFRYLPKKDLDALVSYVVHLALRGEVEYALLGDRIALLRAIADQAKGPSSSEAQQNLDKLKSARENLAAEVQKQLALSANDWVTSNQDDKAILHPSRTAADGFPVKPDRIVETGATLYSVKDNPHQVLNLKADKTFELTSRSPGKLLKGEGNWQFDEAKRTLTLSNSKFFFFVFTVNDAKEIQRAFQPVGQVRVSLGTSQYIVVYNDQKDTLYPYAEVPKTPEEQEEIVESVRRGHQLFLGEAGCINCHKDYGRQNGFLYDVWGTLVRPANLTVATYRGGRRPIDLYYRTHSGIDPSRMPAQGENLRKDGRKLWDLVNFVQTMPYPYDPLNPNRSDRLPQDVSDQIYGPAARTRD